jgi:hypothetical protein
LDTLLDSQVRDLKAAVLASGLGENFDWVMRDASWAGYFNHELPALFYTQDQELFFTFEYHDEIHDPYGLVQSAANAEF